jgi:hypothetical protein
MLVIRNIDKLYPINAMQVEIKKIQTEPDFYRFNFVHENYDNDCSYTLNRDEFDKNKFKGLLAVDGGKSIRYDIDSKTLVDPFSFIKFLNEILYDYDIITNK